MVICADGVCRRFLRKRADSNVFWAVERTGLTLSGGELHVIYGHSGSGKSTLLNMLGGILAPTEGRVLYDGTDIYRLSDRELSALRGEQVGMIPQGQTAIRSLSVLENIYMPYTIIGRDVADGTDRESKAVRERAQELLSLMQIEPLAPVMPSELSGGELRRMAVARALIRNPRVILADEPTGDLDGENTKIVLEILRRQADEGRLVVVVTHDREVPGYADHIWRMDKGRLTPENGEGAAF